MKNVVLIGKPFLFSLITFVLWNISLYLFRINGFFWVHAPNPLYIIIPLIIYIDLRKYFTKRILLIYIFGVISVFGMTYLDNYFYFYTDWDPTLILADIYYYSLFLLLNIISLLLAKIKITIKDIIRLILVLFFAGIVAGLYSLFWTIIEFKLILNREYIDIGAFIIPILDSTLRIKYGILPATLVFFVVYELNYYLGRKPGI